MSALDDLLKRTRLVKELNNRMAPYELAQCSRPISRAVFQILFAHPSGGTLCVEIPDERTLYQRMTPDDIVADCLRAKAQIDAEEYPVENMNVITI